MVPTSKVFEKLVVCERVDESCFVSKSFWYKFHVQFYERFIEISSGGSSEPRNCPKCRVFARSSRENALLTDVHP